MQRPGSIWRDQIQNMCHARLCLRVGFAALQSSAGVFRREIVFPVNPSAVASTQKARNEQVFTKSGSDMWNGKLKLEKSVPQRYCWKKNYRYCCEDQ